MVLLVPLEQMVGQDQLVLLAQQELLEEEAQLAQLEQMEKVLPSLGQMALQELQAEMV